MDLDAMRCKLLIASERVRLEHFLLFVILLTRLLLLRGDMHVNMNKS